MSCQDRFKGCIRRVEIGLPGSRAEWDICNSLVQGAHSSRWTVSYHHHSVLGIVTAGAAAPIALCLFLGLSLPVVPVFKLQVGLSLLFLTRMDGCSRLVYSMCCCSRLPRSFVLLQKDV
eukprot:1152634-Pelagomonas_calceolata.AAC.2